MRKVMAFVVVLALMFPLASCKKGDNGVGPSPITIVVVPVPNSQNYTWEVPAGTVSIKNIGWIVIPAGCIKVELVSTFPAISGTLPAPNNSNYAYLKWKISVCSQAPATSDGKGYYVGTSITEFGSGVPLTNFATGSYPVNPGETKEFEMRPIISADLPNLMPAIELVVLADGGYYKDPAPALTHPTHWFVLNWRIG